MSTVAVKRLRAFGVRERPFGPVGQCFTAQVRQSLAGRMCEPSSTGTFIVISEPVVAAHKLYQNVGFVLESEQEGQQWGKSVVEQCFVRQGV